MRRLIQYFRQYFCKHKFQKEEKEYLDAPVTLGGYSNNWKVSLLCLKCGYHKSFWKY